MHLGELDIIQITPAHKIDANYHLRMSLHISRHMLGSFVYRTIIWLIGPLDYWYFIETFIFTINIRKSFLTLFSLCDDLLNSLS